ncbi:MAG: hypothetical protein ABIH21_03975 [Patescibacteria group bacterium]
MRHIDDIIILNIAENEKEKWEDYTLRVLLKTTRKTILCLVA